MKTTNVLEMALEALESLQEEKRDYMVRNNLGNPTRETNYKLAVTAIAALKEAIRNQGGPEGREVRLTAPEKIYLLVSDESIHDDEPFPNDHEGIYWCEDAALDCYVPYVRADLAYTSAPTIPEGWKLVRTEALDNIFDNWVPTAYEVDLWNELSAAPKGEQP